MSDESSGCWNFVFARRARRTRRQQQQRRRHHAPSSRQPQPPQQDQQRSRSNVSLMARLFGRTRRRVSPPPPSSSSSTTNVATASDVDTHAQREPNEAGQPRLGTARPSFMPAPTAPPYSDSWAHSPYNRPPSRTSADATAHTDSDGLATTAMMAGTATPPASLQELWPPNRRTQDFTGDTIDVPLPGEHTVRRGGGGGTRSRSRLSSSGDGGGDGEENATRIEINFPDVLRSHPGQNPAEALRQHIVEAIALALLNQQELHNARFEAKRVELKLEAAMLQWRLAQLEHRYDTLRAIDLLMKETNTTASARPQPQRMAELEEQLVLLRHLHGIAVLEEQLVVARYQSDGSETRRIQDQLKPIMVVLDLAQRGIVTEQHKQVERERFSDRLQGTLDCTPAPTNIDQLETELRCQRFYVACLEKRGSGKLPIRVHRADVYSNFKELARTKPASDLKSRLSVAFADEEGQDFGGVSREWFGLLGHDCLRAGLACGALKQVGGGGGGLVQFMPNPTPSADVLDYALTLGRVVGLALFHRKTVGIRFTEPFIKQALLGADVELSDLQSVDKEYHKNLQQLLENPGAEDLCLDFTMTNEMQDGTVVVSNIIDRGNEVDVTDSNKREYVDRLLRFQYKDGVRQQNAAFFRGFTEFIPASSVRQFSAGEVISLIAGSSTIDVDNWREETVYEEYDKDSQIVQWFWEIVADMSDEQRNDLLRFSTGCSHIPIEGFKGLQGTHGTNKFTIAKAGDTRYLPVAHTCVNRMDIPEYSTKEELKSKLETAISETEGFAIV
ncbi:ubiquitin protein ligase [Salpingoeca rosetta]|uniref:HECT-type E3 ubiquitin transferase n=1 Tax=Salpingoeca rosetta (strain ATCC 50818 / BSB-021) TaxID=946362 RepID=F2UKP1_SALR5|nr:ubiquitin protein ligase [Salpingoeca rosetta]EGD77690.1 ubiquitin protein ligase [Salpingoeca rosetta]|eukprot:XP_004990166.1 ubiquitin protein ligase [Salpingoeca rosetta]